MKKRTKTTDSVLKDIFDPLIQNGENSSHPLSDFSRENAKNRVSAPPGNRIESWTEETQTVSEEFDAKLDEVRHESILFKDEEPAAPEEPVALESAEVFEAPVTQEAPALAADETAEISEPAAAPKVAPEAAQEIVPAATAEIKKTPQMNHRLVQIFVILVFAGLSCLLGYFLYTQNHEIEQKKFAAKVPAAIQAPASASPQSNPVSYWLSGIPHQGVVFKSFSAKNKKLMIKGSVSNQAELVKFVNSINHSAFFKNAKITAMQEVKASFWQKNYNFQLYADINFSK